MAKTRLALWLLRNHEQAQILRSPSRAIDWAEIRTPEFQNLIDDMLVTMRQANGIGLAAPQIGNPIRLAVIDGQAAHRREPLILINPTIDQISPDQISFEEGCLSIPKAYGLVPRAARLRLSAIDREGQSYQRMADDLLARVIQHELDHLNGRLFIDRMTELTSGKIP